jgi:hypothetical protein
MERLLQTLREAELEFELAQMKRRILQLEHEKSPFVTSFSPIQGEPLIVSEDGTVLKVAAWTRMGFHARYGRFVEARSFTDAAAPFIRLYAEHTEAIPKFEQLEAVNKTLVNFQKMLAAEYRNKETP